MALPLMDPDPTKATTPPANPPLTIDDTVRDAWVRLRATGEPAAVVMRFGRPFVVVTRAAVERAVASGRAEDAVASVADVVAVPVDRSADALTTVHRFTRLAWDWLRYDRGR